MKCARDEQETVSNFQRFVSAHFETLRGRNDKTAKAVPILSVPERSPSLKLGVNERGWSDSVSQYEWMVTMPRGEGMDFQKRGIRPQLRFFSAM